GHIHPLVPLATALGSRGHDVCWATGPDGCTGVEQAGFEAVAAGLSRPERFAELVRRYPELEELPADEQPDFMFAKVFGEIGAPAPASFCGRSRSPARRMTTFARTLQSEREGRSFT